MPPKKPPTDPTAQLQWLVDRAAISDLLIDFARALDDRDWEGYAANYTEDGVLVIMGKTIHIGREGMAENTSAGLGRYAGTHHLSANHAITIDGDTATTRSYLIAAHVFDAADPYRHADGAGWYRCRLHRMADGWRFAHVELEIRYLSGDPLLS
jgi:uncharacterized protein (TIGR02246 family)